MSSAPSTVRIGGFSAFWGDTPTASHQLMDLGSADRLDYLVGDYLAEVTLCLLARVKSKTSQKRGAGIGGYVAEFVPTVFVPLLDKLRDQGTKLVTNAGGMHPEGLKAAMEEAAAKAGKAVPRIAVVLGDDLTPRAEKLLDEGSFKPFGVFEGAEETFWQGRAVSCNAYLGAFPIARALAEGAEVVITGRTVDSALVLGPLIHEFGWGRSDYDLLSAGSLAGHLIECGAQCTGGNFTDWRDGQAQGWSNPGFPIAECCKDGSIVLTKPRGTGGLVSVGTVSEQMMYEILDPADYRLPDVFCDWTEVQIAQLPELNGSASSQPLPSTGLRCSNRVLITGAKGRSPGSYYKVGTTTMKDWSASAELLISGFEAREKALAVAEAILSKTSQLFRLRKLPDYLNTNVELLGAEHTYGPLAAEGARATREIVLRISVVHPDRLGCQIFGLEVAPTATALAPGITGAGAGRPKISPCIRYHSCLLAKELVPVSLVIGGAPPIDAEESSARHPSPEAPFRPAPAPPAGDFPPGLKLVPAQLVDLCYGRSGDKGDVCNIALIARRPQLLPFISRTVTEEAVAQHLGHLIKGQVRRYLVPGIGALNFVCTKALGGGGVESLQIDRQGKSYAQKLLSLPVLVPEAWLRGKAAPRGLESRL